MADLRNWGSYAAEIASPMPGDDFVSASAATGTRAIDIGARPDRVFDFLAQMGFGRAGWYSYDVLDNLGRWSASTINPTWLVHEAGETVPGGPIRFIAAIVDRPTRLVLQVRRHRNLGHTIDFTLAYHLDPSDESTRLVSRVRIAIDGPAGGLLSKAVLLGDGIMVRKQLLGIKKRCESPAHHPAQPG